VIPFAMTASGKPAAKRRCARGLPFTFALLVATVAFALLLAAPAQATDEHLFDPVLSLTESATATTPEDEVVDPGTAHPEKRFEYPCGVATDPHGDIYVSSPVLKFGSTVASRIDVFNPQGEFLVRTEVEDSAACGLAVDSDGNVYTGGIEGQIDLFQPSSYPPTASTTYSVTELIPNPFSTLGCNSTAVAVDPSNDHFYLSGPCRALEYGSAAEGSPPVGEFTLPKGEISGGTPFLSGIDVYGKNHDIYAAVKMQTEGGLGLPDRLYVFDGGDGHVKCEILGVEAPGDLEIGLGASVAVDQANGDLYLYNTKEARVYQFAVEGEGECGFIGRLPEPPTLSVLEPMGDLAIDDPIEEGEAGYESPNEGYVFVTSGKGSATSHLYAYAPKSTGAAPKIEGQDATGVTEAEAVLRAELNPGGLETTYHFQYTTEADFKANGYANAMSVPVPDAELPKGGAFVPVYEPITGLEASTPYRFRLVASNCDAEGAQAGDCLTVGEGKPGEEGEDAGFATYPSAPASGPCPNAAMRIGASASLPDCRAYELVTPPDTGGHVPKISILGEGYGEVGFDTAPVSPDGASVVFGSNSGALPGIGGGGYFDIYEAVRQEAAGWQSQFIGPTAAQAQRPQPGGISPDHGYAFWDVESDSFRGTLSDPERPRVTYLRVSPGIESSPNCSVASESEGRFEWIGCGSLGVDREAAGKWISRQGNHVIFRTGYTFGKLPPARLEPCAPPDGVRAIYDRTPGGPTHCISVPPAGVSAEVEAQFETTDAQYNGTAADGTTVAFAVAGTLYARLDNAKTVTVAEGDPEFGGVSRNGDWVFYLDGPSGFSVPQGEIYACEVALGPCAGPGTTQEPVQIGSGGESSFVNVSADGSHVYFVSPVVLTGEEENEWGAKATAGAENLYVWDGESVRFVAPVDPLDVVDVGETGLGRWVRAAVSPDQSSSLGPANDPSRTTPDGRVLVFESQAALTGYDSDGYREIFRYDTEAPAGSRLSCVSCNPTGTPAGSDARLEIPELGFLESINPSPVNAITQIANVSSDGDKVFFQSGDRLVAGDLDGKLDVYEWEAQGQGGCEREGGCLSLISYGRSTEDDYLYAMTPDGHDVFFLSADTLVGQDPDETPSIYDARMEGGFPPPSAPPAECLGEACQPAASPPGEFDSVLEEEAANPGKPSRRCPKGKRRITSKGKARCVPSRRCPKGKRRITSKGKARCVPSRRCPKGKRRITSKGKARCVKPHRKKNKHGGNHRANTNRSVAR
jgi:hypothetical protein